MKGVAIFLLLLLCQSASAQYALQTLEQRWPGIALVAVVEVGPVTEVSTPQGLVLQSATAKIKQLVYRRFEPLEGEDTDEVTIYSLMPNGLDLACPAPVRIEAGPAFVMVPLRGAEKYSPSDPWEFQPLRGDSIRWPTKKGIEERPLKDVLAEISDYAVKHAHQD